MVASTKTIDRVYVILFESLRNKITREEMNNLLLDLCNVKGNKSFSQTMFQLHQRFQMQKYSWNP